MEKVKLREKPWVRIEIDLNSRDKEGHVRARLSRASGRVEVNEVVTVFEPDDKVAARAQIVRIDRQNDFVYLDVDWASLRDDYRDIELVVNTASSGPKNIAPLLLSNPKRQKKFAHARHSDRKKPRVLVFSSGFGIVSAGSRSLRALVPGSTSSSGVSNRIREVVVQ